VLKTDQEKQQYRERWSEVFEELLKLGLRFKRLTIEGKVNSELAVGYDWWNHALPPNEFVVAGQLMTESLLRWMATVTTVKITNDSPVPSQITANKHKTRSTDNNSTVANQRLPTWPQPGLVDAVSVKHLSLNIESKQYAIEPISIPISLFQRWDMMHEHPLESLTMRFRGQVQDICQWIKECCPPSQADKLLAPRMMVHFILEAIDNTIFHYDVIPGVMKILKALIDWETLAPGRVNAKINFRPTKSTKAQCMVRGGAALDSNHPMKAAWEQGRITVCHPMFSEINSTAKF
jgi:hypothetical protein